MGAEMTPGTGPVPVEGLMSGPTTQSAVRPRPQRGSPSLCSGPSAPPPYAPVGQRGDWRGFPEGVPARPRPARLQDSAMWSHVTSIFGRFGRTALATEPCASTDFSAATSAVPGPSSPTYSPPNSPVRNVVPPDAPELWPCPPSDQWMAKVTAIQTSGMRYDDSIFACGIVGYYRPPRWLAAFKECYLSNFVPSVWKLDLPRPPDAPKRFHYEWCQRALRELFEGNQMQEQNYHDALIELSRLGRDVVDDPDVAAICNAELETFSGKAPACPPGSCRG